MTKLDFIKDALDNEDLCEVSLTEWLEALGFELNDEFIDSAERGELFHEYHESGHLVWNNDLSDLFQWIDDHDCEILEDESVAAAAESAARENNTLWGLKCDIARAAGEIALLAIEDCISNAVSKYEDEEDGEE